MFRLSIQMLKHKKQTTIMMLLIIMFAFALVLSVVPTFTGIEQSVIDVTFDKYGEHQSIIYDLTLEQLEYGKNTDAISHLGIITNYGRFEIDGTQTLVTLGHFDEEALHLGHIRIEEGRLPETATEIALEKNLLLRIEEELEIGSTFTVAQNKTEYTYIITGFLSNYTGIWSGAEDLRYGYNDIPQGYIVENNSLIGTCHGLVTESGSPIEAATHLVEKFGNDWVMNSKLTSAYYNDVGKIELFKNIFLLLSIVASGLAIWVGVSFYIDQYKSVNRMLYALGAQNEPFKIYSLQQIIILGVGIVLGLGIAYVFSLFSLRVYPEVQFSLKNIQTLLSTVILIIITLLLIYIGYLCKIKCLRGKSKSEENKIKIKQLKPSKGRIALPLTWHYIKTNYTKMIPIVILIVLLCSVLSFTQIYFNHFEFTYSVLEEADADFYVGTDYDAFVSIGPVAIELTSNRYMPKDLFAELYQMEGVRYVDAGYATNNARLLIGDVHDAYWQRMQKDVADQMFDVNEIPSIPQDVLPIHERMYTNFFVLNDFNLQFFKEAYPDVSLEGLQEGKAIVFLPQIKQFPNLENSEMLSNKTLREGGYLRFGYLFSEKLFEEMMEDLPSVKYIEKRIKIDKIMQEPMIINANGLSISVEIPAIIVSEQTFLENDLFTGVKRAHIYLDEDISEINYEKINQFMRKLGSSADSLQVFSLRETKAENQRFMNVVNTAMSYVVLILGLFCVATIFAAQYLNIMKRKKSISILRALGMKRKQLFASVFMEVLFYLLIALTLSLVCYAAILQRVFTETLYIALNSLDLFAVLTILGVCFGVGIIVCLTSMV